HIPRKRFGQNFLIDTQVINSIIACIKPQADQHIVEIGPGQAALTNSLIASGAKVDAIELDRDLAEMLQVNLAGHKNFSLYEGDILKFDLHYLLINSQDRKLRLVGNLPYNISTPLLFKLFTDTAII